MPEGEEHNPAELPGPLATARRLMRIAVARADTIQDVLARLKLGGMKAMWATTRARSSAARRPRPSS